MLDYSKMILEKVSFDPALFKKELRKLSKWLTISERKVLLHWCKENFPKHIIY